MCLIEKSNKTWLIEQPLNALWRTPAVSSSCKWPKWRDANRETNGMEGGQRAVRPIRHSRNSPTRWWRWKDIKRDVEGGTGKEKDSCGFWTHSQLPGTLRRGGRVHYTSLSITTCVGVVYGLICIVGTQVYEPGKKQQETTDGFILTLLESNHNKIHNMLTIGLSVKVKWSIAGSRTDAVRSKQIKEVGGGVGLWDVEENFMIWPDEGDVSMHTNCRNCCPQGKR